VCFWFQFLVLNLEKAFSFRVEFIRERPVICTGTSDTEILNIKLATTSLLQYVECAISPSLLDIFIHKWGEQ
jgi:hypothetical protein